MLCVLLICVILWEKVRTLAMRWHPSKSLGCIISHRTHRFNRTFLVHAFVHWKFFLSQSAQSSRSFLAHISSPQKASGIQSSQSVTANVGTNKGQQVAYILLIGVSRWLLPSLLGRGRGRGLFLIGVSRWSRPSLWGRGRGRGQLGEGGGATACFECCVFGDHSPLHSERGRGRGLNYPFTYLKMMILQIH